MKEYIYFSAKYGGHLGVLTIYEDGFIQFEVDGACGPVESMPEMWNGAWEILGEL